MERELDLKQIKDENKMEISERTFRLIAELAVQKEAEEALEKMAATDAAGVPPEETAMLQRLNARFTMQLEKHCRKQRVKKMFATTIPRTARVAAAVIAIVSVTGTIAIATSQTVRTKVMELLYTVEKQYTKVTMQENEAASFDVPVEWKEDYFPAFIPDGLHISQIDSNAQSSFITWSDSENTVRLHFFVEKDTSTSNVDTENAEVKYFEMGSIQDGMLVLKGNDCTAVWRIFNRYFILHTYNYDEDTTMKIVENAQIIK